MKITAYKWFELNGENSISITVIMQKQLITFHTVFCEHKLIEIDKRKLIVGLDNFNISFDTFRSRLSTVTTFSNRNETYKILFIGKSILCGLKIACYKFIKPILFFY